MPAVKDFTVAAKSGSTIAFTLTPQSIAADGTLTPVSALSVRGQCKRFKIASNPQKENISSVDSPRANNVPVEENLRVEVEELQRNTLNANVLPNAVGNYDVFAILFGYAHILYGPIYVSRGDFSDGIENKGNNSIEATFDLVDVGQTSILPITNS